MRREEISYNHMKFNILSEAAFVRDPRRRQKMERHSGWGWRHIVKGKRVKSQRSPVEVSEHLRLRSIDDFLFLLNPDLFQLKASPALSQTCFSQLIKGVDK